MFLVVVALLIGITIPGCNGGSTGNGSGTGYVPPPPPPPAQPAFADSYLEATIRQTLNKLQGSITAQDLESITALEASDMGISDLAGLEYCINLQYLDLSGNNITDISPLAGLSNLLLVHLEDNAISDISPIEELINLAVLHLEGNGVIDISPLVANSGLATGDMVGLTANPLNSTSLSTSIPQMVQRGVSVEWTTSSGVSTTGFFPDSSLEAAVRQALSKPQGQISVVDLMFITVLEAPEAGISDLTGLEDCVNLQYLDLSGNNISDISPLEGLTSLMILRLEGNNISDISPLEELTNIVILQLSSNNINDISPLIGNSGIAAGDWVDLTANPLNNSAVNTSIPQLALRGVAVEW